MALCVSESMLMSYQPTNPTISRWASSSDPY
jgi:hypothetical protein